MHSHVPANRIRLLFADEMSHLYRTEVPAYAKLLQLVGAVELACGGRADASIEWHGAIRLGTAAELSLLRRLFAVMAMYPVGYYDLSVADLPVHSTAFRPISQEALAACPLRIFTSLLDIDAIGDADLRGQITMILDSRNIVEPRLLELIERAERDGGLPEREAIAFSRHAARVFRWRGDATVSAGMYARLSNTHRLIADIVAFPGPHINHLTPRTSNIGMIQEQMRAYGLRPKESIEGPPARRCPILLRQTAYKAIPEPIRLLQEDGTRVDAVHSARFGEVEQRGAALTPKGRALYDAILAKVFEIHGAGDGRSFDEILRAEFKAFPDDEKTLRSDGLAYFEYSLGEAAHHLANDFNDVEGLIARGLLKARPIKYEDFLPVSAAGIFRSNLNDDHRSFAKGRGDIARFESALGARVVDPFDLYRAQEEKSLAACLEALRSLAPAACQGTD